MIPTPAGTTTFKPTVGLVPWLQHIIYYTCSNNKEKGAPPTFTVDLRPVSLQTHSAHSTATVQSQVSNKQRPNSSTVSWPPLHAEGYSQLSFLGLGWHSGILHRFQILHWLYKSDKTHTLSMGSMAYLTSSTKRHKTQRSSRIQTV